MAIPTTLESLSATAASNGPSGSDQRTLADDGLRQAYAFIHQLQSQAVLASAATVTPPSTARIFSVTGTTSITTIASTNSFDGRDILFIFAGILTLTNGSNLILPGSANITTAVGDAAWLVQVASGQWRAVGYSRADGSWAYGNITASAFIPSGSTVPTNGLYLKAVNNPALASNTTLRWDVNSTGNHTIAAATASDTLSVNSAGGATAAIITNTTNAGSTNLWTLYNPSNTASSSAKLLLAVGGASSDDPFLAYSVQGITSWSAGVDNSDSDRFKISQASTLGTNDRVVVDTAGNVTINAPSSGVPLTVNTSANASVNLAGSTTSANYIRNTNTGGDGAWGLDSSAGGIIFSGSLAYSMGIGTFSATAVCIGTSNATRLVVTSDGRFYGTALHNNAGAVTGTTNQYIASGTYTPTLTNVANITGSPTAGLFNWMRVGNVVHVAGSISAIQPTVSGNSVNLGISLPIASNFTSATNDLTGVVSVVSHNIDATVQADTVNDRAQTDYIQGDTSSTSNYIMFQYVVL